MGKIWNETSLLVEAFECWMKRYYCLFKYLIDIQKITLKKINKTISVEGNMSSG